MEIEAEVRLVPRPGDLDGKPCAAFVAFEERIDGFQHDRLPPGGGLRELGLELGDPVEIQTPVDKTILTVQAQGNTRNAKGEPGEPHPSVAEDESPREIRSSG